MSYNVEELCEFGKPIAMSMLLEAVGRRDTLTYQIVANRLSEEMRTVVSPLHIGHVAGALMDRIIEVDAEAPPINALVVNKITKLPGHGATWYVERFLPNVKYKALSKAEKRAVLQPVHDAIYSFEDWDDVARAAFGDDLPAPKVEKKKGENDGKARRLGFGGPPESGEHLRLKEFVAANPRQFGAPRGCFKGMQEKRLESWDEIDVWFMMPSEQLAVEVKSRRSSEVDIQRGLFQCVKYRAVLQAQMEVLKAEPEIRVRLVSERSLSAKHAEWARQLDIEVQIIDPLPS